MHGREWLPTCDRELVVASVCKPARNLRIPHEPRNHPPHWGSAMCEGAPLVECCTSVARLSAMPEGVSKLASRRNLRIRTTLGKEGFEESAGPPHCKSRTPTTLSPPILQQDRKTASELACPDRALRSGAFCRCRTVAVAGSSFGSGLRVFWNFHMGSSLNKWFSFSVSNTLMKRILKGTLIWRTIHI